MRLVGMLLWGPLACAPPPGTAPRSEPSLVGSAGPVVSARLAEPDDVRACGGCHGAIVKEWSASEHRGSWSDPVFAASYALDHQPGCRRCHAPLAPGDEDPLPPSVAARNGISCRTCHRIDGEIAGPSGTRVHGGSVDPRWGQGAFCGGCHEFTFSAGTQQHPPIFDPREPMQRTMSEWAAATTEQTCQDCHMPWVDDDDGGRHRSHRMLGIHDRAFMERAVRVELHALPPQPDGTTVVEARVHADAIGHAFPTGDMFRLAELRVWPEAEPEASALVVTMRREFGPVVRRDDQGRPRLILAEVADTRPRPGRPLRRRLRFEGRPSALRWSLVHLRMPVEHARRQGVSPSALEREVSRGVVSIDPLRGDTVRP